MIGPAFKLPKEINLGFSCGKDSIAIAHYLKGRGKTVNLIHVNNKLDGDDVIAQQCQEFADCFGFPLDIIVSPPKPGSLENECRNSRIAAFQKYDRVILAHHLGDAVEWYLALCLSGKPAYQPIRFISQWDKTTILRPFALTEPNDIQSYLDKHDLNRYIAYDRLTIKSRRYWMRTRLLPTLKEWNYDLRKVVRKMLLEQLKEIKL